MVNVRIQKTHLPRFNVLLTEEREPTTAHWTRQLPRLLQPQGVRAFVARTGEEAFELVGRQPIHAALIDCSTPRTADTLAPGESAGLWMLELFRRLPSRPPIIVVNNRLYTERDLQRFLNQALRLGAFSVINQPTDLETLLRVIQRVLDRRYAGHWPEVSDADPEDVPPGDTHQASPD